MMSTAIQSNTFHRPRILTQILVLCDSLNCVGFTQIGTVHLHAQSDGESVRIDSRYMYISSCKPVAENRGAVVRIQQATERVPWSMLWEGRLSASYSLCSQSLLCRAEGITADGHHIRQSRHNIPKEHTLYWDSDSYSANREISLIFWCLNAHRRFHRSPLGTNAVTVPVPSVLTFFFPSYCFPTN